MVFKNPFLARFCSFILILFFLNYSDRSFAQDAYSIMKKADEKMRGNSSMVEMEMKTIRPSWSRTMELKAWNKGKDLAMILILTPARDKGVSFLKRKKEVWNWYPSLERTIKLPPSMMNQNWMGTDFTNDDLVRESSVLNDYIHKRIGDTLIEQRNCHIIEMIPKPNAPVVWARVLVYVDIKDDMELYSRFYDEDGKLVNVMRASEPKMMDGRLIPTKFEMIPMDKPGHKTEMRYKNIRFNMPIDDSFFTTEKMKTIR